MRHTLHGRFRTYIRHMRLTDKFLFFYLLLLLLQMTYTVFHESSSQVYAAVDTMMRTTAATIFGYFISATFEKEEDASTENNQTTDIRSSEKNTRTSLPEENTCRRNCRIHQQTVIVAGIGTLSLGILILLRNTAVPLPQGPTPISLMQDFIVGSIGFLIGHAKYDQS